MHAYIYARFSTLEQAKGSSLARQLEDCRAFCDRQGWARSVERELVDEGRSAFDGTNRAEGSGLAEFERKARQGELPPGTILVVERLDRISRQSAFEVFTLISGLTEAGVAIATVDGERVYTRGNVDFGSLIELIVDAKFAPSKSEARRLIEQGGVKINGEPTRDLNAPLTQTSPFTLQVGKLKIAKITLI